MAPTLALGLIAAIPIILILLLRSNAAVVFLSLCAGSVLVAYAGSDVSDAANRTFSKSNTSSFVEIGLLLLPALLSLWFLRKSISPSKLVINIFAAVAVAVAAVILLVPLLPGGIRFNIMHSSIWGKTDNYHGALLGAGTAIAIISLWLTNRHKGDGKHKKQH